MPLDEGQDEFMEALLEHFKENSDALKPGFETSIITDNCARYEENGNSLFLSEAQWKWIKIIAENKFGIVYSDYV